MYGNHIVEVIQIRDHTQPVPEDVYAHRDDLFSVYAITDDTGVVTQRYLYGDYGTRITTDPAGTAGFEPALEVDHGFTGRLHDETSGLIEYRHRWMRPEMGRFVQRGPLWYVDGMNVYRYGASNPASRVDPKGLCSQNATPHQQEDTYIDSCTGGGERRCLIFRYGCNGTKLLELWQNNGYHDEAFDAERRACGASDNHDNICDAFRHCYWSCLIAVEISSDCARAVGERHEACGNNPQNEIDMDTYNEARGREFCRQCEKQWGKKSERSCCLDKCKATMNDGTLWPSPR